MKDIVFLSLNEQIFYSHSQQDTMVQNMAQYFHRFKVHMENTPKFYK